MSQIILNGKNLSTDFVSELARNPNTNIGISNSARSEVRKSYKFLNRELGRKIIYGVNTGFGPMASHIIDQPNLLKLQKNLIYSHAVGMGEPIRLEFVLAQMVVRLNTLIKGYSGISEELIDRLKLFINRRVIPVVPDHGAVGTSGDLVQLAHIALALEGGGEVFYKNKRRLTLSILKKLRLKPYKFKPKEGLALINGTSAMSGIGSVLVSDAEKLVNLEIRLSAFALELVGGFSDSISKKLSDLRPHQSQIAVAKALRNLLLSSKLMRDRAVFQKGLKRENGIHKMDSTVQEIYSLRCVPQIIGPILDTVHKTKQTLEIEINSVTDNPAIDVRGKAFIHGGNFHGDYVSSAIDQMKMVIVKLMMLSERRINFFLNRNVNRKYPPFLNLGRPGLELALQGLQFVATSTTARSQTLAFPQYVHSIPTNADNQDVVSMGTDAALIASQVIDNAFVVLTIELVTLAQLVDVLDVKNKLTPNSRELYRFVRRVLAKTEDDRIINNELANLLQAVKNETNNLKIQI